MKNPSEENASTSHIEPKTGRTSRIISAMRPDTSYSLRDLAATLKVSDVAAFQRLRAHQVEGWIWLIVVVGKRLYLLTSQGERMQRDLELTECFEPTRLDRLLGDVCTRVLSHLHADHPRQLTSRQLKVGDATGGERGIVYAKALASLSKDKLVAAHVESGKHPRYGLTMRGVWLMKVLGRQFSDRAT